jgi:SAM-dependent methyltransferase
VSEAHKYDNAVQPDNKFGHTLVLLERHLGAREVEEDTQAIHLDLACGYGHIADPIIDKFGLHYVGVDVDDDELDTLRERGLEAHAADLTDPDVADRLAEIIDGRPVASITFLDGLEHLTDGRPSLRAVGSILAANRAIAVTSVPNVTHVDVGLKTLMGQWTYTEAGLLDITHYQLFSHDSLVETMAQCGLRKIDTHDVLLARSDQFFPEDHVALNTTTPMSAWLRGVRDQAEPHGLVNQFVWALTAAPPRPARDLNTPPRQAGEVFLSVVMRTQGRRPQELREALLCLSAQSSQDFEVLIVAHKTEISEQKSVEQIIEDQPPYLKDRIRLLLLDRGKRSAPINFGLENAKGRYIAIFDDDDIVMGDWVKEFADAERGSQGRILRCLALRQAASVDTVLGHTAIRSTSAPEAMYSPEFSLTQHLVENQSPPIGWVFPRSLVTDFGLRYDDSMTTTEDWEFLLRAAELAGVRDVGRGTAIYRWWETRESSRTEHPQHEWAQNQAEIERRIDARPFLLPAGETRQLREDLRELRRLRKQVRQQQRAIGKLEVIQARRLHQINRLRGRLAKAKQAKPKGPVLRPTAVMPARPATRMERMRQVLRPRTRLRSLARRVRR